MYFGIKDIVLYGAIGLVALLLVNHYGQLNIPFLNYIEDGIVGDSDSGGFDDEDSTNVFDYADIEEVSGNSRKCVTARKMAGDAKFQIRKKIQAARKARDDDVVTDMEERLALLQEKISAACDEG